MKYGIVIFDLDDTLVDTESVYHRAQEAMLTIFKKHCRSIDFRKAFKTLREIDHELVLLHNGDHAYGYWKLAEALWLHFQARQSVKDATKTASKMRKRDVQPFFVLEAAEAHDSIIRNIVPELLDDAMRVVKHLKRKYVLVLLSEGDRTVKIPVIRYHRFDRLFDEIVLPQRKNKVAFLRAKRKGERVLFGQEHVKRYRLVFVGARISQDIMPGQKIGAETIWIKGPYFPGTTREARPDHSLAGLTQLLRIL